MAGRPVPVAVREQACAAVRAGRTAADVAAELGVSAASVRRWTARAASGEGLADRPRSGRPRIQDTAAAVVSAVLATAGARIDAPDYSTRAVAVATGLSQSVVSRAMSGLAVGPRSPRFRLVAVVAAYPVLLLGCAEVAASAVRTRGGRAFRRRCAGVTAALGSAGLVRWERQFGATAGAEVPEPARAVLEARGVDRIIAFDPQGALRDSADGDGGRRAGRGCAMGHAEEPAAGRRDGGARLTAVSEHAEFVDTVREALGAVDAIPGALLTALAARVSRGLEGLVWIADGADLGTRSAAETRSIAQTTSSESSAAVRDASGDRLPQAGLVPDSHWMPRENLSLTEQLAIALRQEIIDSGYRSGDRIRPRQLASRLGVPQAAVDAAIRRMIDEELLAGGRGGVRIPAVTADDVIDLYAARLVLGAVLLRGLAARPRRHLVPVRQALRRVEAVAALRRGTDVEDADLRFQQELARTSGLEQTARTFESLTRRLRMYISVLLLDYTPATDRIVLDDRRIVRALEAADAAAAVEAWRGKLDNAVRHMAGIAQHRGFDVAAWTRLTAR